jgi:Tol biopolymer transport system component
MLAITVATTGPSVNPQAYIVRVDEQSERHTGDRDTLVVLAEPGAHTVMLRQIAENCIVTGDTVRSVTVLRSDTTWVSFELACVVSLGSIRVTTTAAGEEVDPNGYRLLIDDVEEGATLDPNGVYTVQLASGHHVVSLVDYTANCTFPDGMSREIDIPPGGTSDLTFAATCSRAQPAGPGHEIAFITTRPPFDGHAPQRIYLMNDDGTGLQPKNGVARDFLFALAWLPDGTRLSFMATPKIDDFLGGRISILTPTTGGIDTVFNVNGVYAPSWSPDGQQLAYTDILDVDEGAEQVFVAGPVLERQFAHQLTSDDGAHWSPTWSPDGQRIAYATGKGEGVGIVIRQLSDSSETPLLSGFPGSIYRVVWSPDGATIAFDGTLDFNFTHIFVLPVTGGEATQLTRGRFNNTLPTWSPDGRRLAFTSDRDGNAEIYVMSFDGSGQLRLTNDPGQDSYPAWRP